MRNKIAAAFCMLALCAQAAATPEEKPVTYVAVSLQGLNKVTGHISTIEAAIDKPVRFGTLEIIVKRCWKAPAEDRPEHATLISISEFKPGEGPVGVFQGWMFAESPGLSGLEHPVYDIAVLECLAKVESVPNEKESEKKSPPKK